MSTPQDTTAHALTRAEAYQLNRSALALERLAAHLEALATAPDDRRPCWPLAALVISEAAAELAHHADAIREASGLNARTAANLDALTRNPSTR